MSLEVNEFGVCNWFPEHGLELVAELDRASFTALSPAGKVFRCVGLDADWLLIGYGINLYRVSPEIFKKVRAPVFSIGQQVLLGGRKSVVANISWHFKNEAPIYLLTFDGKQSSRRYDEKELTLVD
jgi:hypothetical protein